MKPIICFLFSFLFNSGSNCFLIASALSFESNKSICSSASKFTLIDEFSFCSLSSSRATACKSVGS